MQNPRAASEPEHGVSLSTDPALVIRCRPGTRGALEEDLGGVGEGDGDDGGFLGREGFETRVEKVAEIPGVFGREGLEGE